MRLIPNATTYAAELPDAGFLAECLSRRAFTPVLKTHVSSCGFVPVPHTGELVAPFPGGYAFTLRIDAKNLPISGILRAQDEAITAYLEVNPLEEGETLAEETELALRDEVMSAMVRNAPISTKIITSYYHTDSNTLIVPTKSAAEANAVTGQLVRALGSLKASTIYISGVRQGLTARLKNHLDEMPDAFEGFTLGKSVLLKGTEGQKKDKLRLDMDDLDDASESLRQAVFGNGMQVDLLEMVYAGVAFKLTDKFRLQAITMKDELTEDEMASRDELDHSELFRVEAGAQVLQLVAVIQKLSQMFSYQRPEVIEEKTYNAETDLHPMLPDATAYLRERQGTPSVTALQREFRLSYNQAATLLDDLERTGIVTAADGDGKREVIQATE